METFFWIGLVVLLVAVPVVVIARRGSGGVMHDSADAAKGRAHSASIARGSGSHGSMP
jgi:hypothetical protein